MVRGPLPFENLLSVASNRIGVRQGLKLSRSRPEDIGQMLGHNFFNKINDLYRKKGLLSYCPGGGVSEQ